MTARDDLAVVREACNFASLTCHWEKKLWRAAYIAKEQTGADPVACVFAAEKAVLAVRKNP